MIKKIFFLIPIFFFSLNGYSQFGPKKTILNNAIPNPGNGFGSPDFIVIDWNNDGYEDVVFTDNTNNLISWIQNLGNEQFSTPQLIANIESPQGNIDIVDFDGDSDLDVIVTSVTFNGGAIASVVLIENLGNGNFSQSNLASGICSLAKSKVIDVDNDSYFDLITIGGCGDLYLIKQTVSGMVSSLIDNTLNSMNQLFEIDDFNGDGLPDILTIETSANSGTNLFDLYIIENLGGGNFSVPHLISNSIPSHEFFTTGDYDNDGDIDVLLTKSYGSYNEYIVLYNNNTFSNWSSSIFPFLSNAKGKMRLADINNDNSTDLVAGEYWNISSSFEYHLIDSLGNSDTYILFDTLTSTTSDNIEIELKDMNNDSSLDIVVFSKKYNQIFWFENLLYSPFKAHGNVFIDNNQNGVKDSTDLGFSAVQVQSSENSAYTTQNGSYFLSLDSGNHVITQNALQNWGLTTPNSFYNVVLNMNTPSIYNLDFGFFPTNIFSEINGDISSNQFVCDNVSELWCNVHNEGTTRPKTLLKLVLDDSVSYVSSSIMPDSIIDQNIYWNIDTLEYFQSENIQIEVMSPDFNSMGDTLKCLLFIYEDSLNNLLLKNVDTLQQILLCAYDPNDKFVFTEKYKFNNDTVSKDDEFFYTVRFQNTGNYFATDVLIVDSLDNNFDIGTFNFISSSHDVLININSSKIVDFYFSNIFLPDSTTDELGSHGYFKYSVKPFSTINPNQVIKNKAYIYFDSNPAIITNETRNVIECGDMIQQVIFQSTDNNILESNLSEIDYNFLWCYNGDTLDNETNYNIDLIGEGEYNLIVTDSNNCQNSFEYAYYLSLYNKEKVKYKVFPIPSTHDVTIEIRNDLISEISVYNNIGREVFFIKDVDNYKFILKNEFLSTGIYYIKIITNSNELINEKFIKL